MASDAQGIPLVLHPRHEWRYIDAEVYPDREVTHRAFTEAEAQALLDMLAAVAICAMAEARIAYDRWCAARSVPDA